MSVAPLLGSYRLGRAAPGLTADAPFSLGRIKVGLLTSPLSFTANERTFAALAVELSDTSACVKGLLERHGGFPSGCGTSPARGCQRAQGYRGLPGRRCRRGVSRWLKVACGYFLLEEASEERDYAGSLRSGDSLVQQLLSNTAGKNVNPQEPVVPARISIDLTIIRHRKLDLLIESTPRLARKLIAKPGIVLLDPLQLRGHDLRGRALGQVNELRTVILDVLVGDVILRRQWRRGLALRGGRPLRLQQFLPHLPHYLFLFAD